MKNRSEMAQANRMMKGEFDSTDYLSYFLAKYKAKLLTAKEEVLNKLEEVKSKLESHFGREPTMFEWAEVVGISYRALQSHIHSSMHSREKLLLANKNLVIHIAKKYIKSHVSLHDLFQAGCLGLREGIDRFKCEYKCRFSTYAYYWIRREVKREMHQRCTFIPLSARTHDLLYRIGRAKRLLAVKGNHNPTAEVLAACVGIKVGKLKRSFLHTQDPISLEQTVEKNAPIRLKDDFVDPSSIESDSGDFAKQDLKQRVKDVLEILKPRDRLVLSLRFGIEDGFPRTLNNIGETLGLSRERVRQLETRAKLRFKKSFSIQESKNV